MSNEVEQEVQVATAEQTEEQQKQTPTTEDLAKEKGWRPKDYYHGDPSNWRSAEVFLALEEPIKKIESLAKELKEQKKQIEMLSKWVLFLIEAQGEIELEAHKVNEKEAHTII